MVPAMDSQNTYVIPLSSVNHTLDLGCALGRVIDRFMRPAMPTLAVGLSGALGAGKTELVRGIIQGIGSTAWVSSPTYVLENDYTVDHRFSIYHWDLYRLGPSSAPPELADRLSGEDSVVIVEWSDYLECGVSPFLLDIHMDCPSGAEGRSALIRSAGRDLPEGSCRDSGKWLISELLRDYRDTETVR